MPACWVREWLLAPMPSSPVSAHLRNLNLPTYLYATPCSRPHVHPPPRPRHRPVLYRLHIQAPPEARKQRSMQPQSCMFASLLFRYALTAQPPEAVHPEVLALARRMAALEAAENLLPRQQRRQQRQQKEPQEKRQRQEGQPQLQQLQQQVQQQQQQQQQQQLQQRVVPAVAIEAGGSQASNTRTSAGGNERDPCNKRPAEADSGPPAKMVCKQAGDEIRVAPAPSQSLLALALPRPEGAEAPQQQTPPQQDEEQMQQQRCRLLQQRSLAAEEDEQQQRLQQHHHHQQQQQQRHRLREEAAERQRLLLLQQWQQQLWEEFHDLPLPLPPPLQHRLLQLDPDAQYSALAALLLSQEHHHVARRPALTGGQHHPVLRLQPTRLDEWQQLQRLSLLHQQQHQQHHHHQHQHGVEPGPFQVASQASWPLQAALATHAELQTAAPHLAAESWRPQAQPQQPQPRQAQAQADGQWPGAERRPPLVLNPPSLPPRSVPQQPQQRQAVPGMQQEGRARAQAQLQQGQAARQVQQHGGTGVEEQALPEATKALAPADCTVEAAAMGSAPAPAADAETAARMPPPPPTVEDTGMQPPPSRSQPPLPPHPQPAPSQRLQAAPSEDADTDQGRSEDADLDWEFDLLGDPDQDTAGNNVTASDEEIFAEALPEEICNLSCNSSGGGCGRPLYIGGYKARPPAASKRGGGHGSGGGGGGPHRRLEVWCAACAARSRYTVRRVVLLPRSVLRERLLGPPRLGVAAAAAAATADGGVTGAGQEVRQGAEEEEEKRAVGNAAAPGGKAAVGDKRQR